MGNRKAEAMTVVTEDSQWHFRGGKVIVRPSGGLLTADVFTDANGDGFVNMKFPGYAFFIQTPPLPCLSEKF